MRLLPSLTVAGLLLFGPSLRAQATFDFEAVGVGTALPFTLSNGNLSVSFTGNGAVCSSISLSSQNMFSSLTGNVITQGYCKPGPGGPLTMAFSKTLTNVSFMVATNGSAPSPVTVDFFNNGQKIGTQTIQPVIPDGFLSGEATVTLAGRFNSVTVSSTALLAIDNVTATPVPSSPYTR